MRPERISTGRDVLDATTQARLKMPRTSRELFQWLALLEHPGGLDALLKRTDLSALRPSIVFDIVHRRRAKLDTIQDDLFCNPIDLFRAALFSDEFQDNIISHFLTAFHELSRIVFFHLPKCLGTDLIINIGFGRLSIAKTLEENSWIGKDDFLNKIGEIARVAQMSDSIFVHGHLLMSDFLDRNSIRSNDELFTIVRDPIEIMISQANYVIGRLMQDPEATAPDTKRTLGRLGIQKLPAEAGQSMLAQLALRALQDPLLCEPNTMCHFLSATRASTFESAMAASIYCDLEFASASTYKNWLPQRWGVQNSMWHNRSEKFISRHDALQTCREYLEYATAEDRKLFDIINWALRESGTESFLPVHFGTRRLA